MKKIILASTSPQRKEIMEKSGLPFVVEASGYFEDMTLNLSPQDLVKHLSLGKAEAVAQRNADAVVIAADTIVSIDDLVFGKPYTPERAKEMLTVLNGRFNKIITGVTIIDTETNTTEFFVNETSVYFREMPESKIDAYIASKEPLDKAGAYAIQGMGAEFIEKIEGDSLNAIGLPLDNVLEILKKFGV